ncbi:hypothetical protein F8M41_016639 [Gigaspora margarita]|uniref:Uncharacterized protein n=1 Tax=Gigaspora margarita TaxID=4874 RepID=A0A8H4AP62_GIGMA|nr:hypothetical protein F8M41_016639 [Gigaspora margarita]
MPEIPEEGISDVDDNKDSENNCPIDQSTIPSEKNPAKDLELKSSSSSMSSTTSQAESITSPSNFSDLYSAIVKAKE